MAANAFFGYLLLAGGPPVVLFCAFVARKSFLVLLTLASAFIWLVSLLIIAALFRGFVPLSPSAGPFAALLVVAVLIQECVRYGVWRLHGVTVQSLEAAAHDMVGTRLTATDKMSMALTYGLAHGGTHSVFLYLSWLPAALGDGTLYTDACPHMSYFLAGALLSLAFFLLHTFSMVVVFDGYRTGKKERRFGPPVLHMLAALLTLASFARNGCLAAVPILLAVGVAMTAWAGQGRGKSEALEEGQERIAPGRRKVVRQKLRAPGQG
ncbi:hypothetical protein WJX72_002392 [[Myrmecia] bisecta]|uniref:Gamma-secretase subunit APH1-like n=1 Tax=[Myrmecia] bisecta TaxID=41462 RepID=A0AAW1Q3K1_9CHLO